MRRALECSIGLVLAACGGVTSQEAREDSGALRTCTIPAGSYTETFAVQAGGMSCPSLAPQTITIFTTTCSTTSSGASSNTSISLVFDGDAAVGRESTDSTDSADNVLSFCNYDIALAKH